MADFEAVLKKTLGGMKNPTPEMRAKVYERARATITRQIESLEKRPPEAVIQRQFDKLEAAISVIEAEYAPPPPPPEAPAADTDADLEHLFEAGVIPAGATEAAEPAPEAAPEPEAPSREDPAREDVAVEQPAMAEAPEAAPAETEEDPLAAFLAQQEQSAAERAEDSFETQADTRGRGMDMPEVVPAGRSRLPWIVAAVAILLIAGAAAFAGRGAIMDLFGSSETMTTENGVPVREAPSTTVTADDTDTSGTDDTSGGENIAAVEAPPKFTQRLMPDGSEVDAGPADPAETTGEGTSVAAQSDAGTDPQPGDAGAAAQADTDDQALLPVGQRAIFYQERTGSQAGTAEAGAAIWSVVQESPGGDLPPEPAIRAEASIPELGLTMEMTIRRNADETFPASHVIELLFRVPDTFEGRGIADVQRITFKGTEQDPGNALIGVAAALDTNIFLIALTDAPTAIETNLNLMRREEWIDIPMQYISGRRALITLEKGIPGEQVFNEVLSAWEKAGTAEAQDQ